MADSEKIAVHDTTAAAIHTEGQAGFISVCKTITSKNINSFIHPERGLWIISSQGALPEMKNVKNTEGNFPADFSNVKDGTNKGLPEVDCDAITLWTKEGCFAQNADLFSDTQIWEYSNLSSEEKNKVLAATENIQWSAVNTVLNARYYFAWMDGRWFLVVADLRQPCQA